MPRPTSNRLLVVDDETEVGDLIATRFRIFGFDVLTATCVQEALQILKGDSTIFSVICDLYMPGGHGTDLIRELRAKHPSYPSIFAISGKPEYSLETLYGLGADGFLAKPFDARNLLSIVRAASLEPSQKYIRPSYMIPSTTIQLTFSNLDLAHQSGVFATGRAGIYLKLSSPLGAPGAAVAINVQADPLYLRGSGFIRWARPSSSDEHHEAGIELQYLEPESLKSFTQWLGLGSPTAAIPTPQIATSMPSKAKLQSTG